MILSIENLLTVIQACQVRLRLTSYPVLETVLQKPLQVGTSFQGWTIESTTATVDTGTTVYQDVIQLSRSEDQMTTTKYFAKGHWSNSQRGYDGNRAR